MPTQTDYELINSYLQKGDEASFNLLVSRYMNTVYRFVLGYVQNPAQAEDITQEVFVKVWKNLKKIDKNRNFKSWLYTVAKNTALDVIKKKKAVPFSRFETQDGKNILAESLVNTTIAPDKAFELLESREMFSRAMEALSEKYKQVLLLYYYQYLNFREIAELLEEPINTIKSRHRRGLMLLEKTVATLPGQ